MHRLMRRLRRPTKLSLRIGPDWFCGVLLPLVTRTLVKQAEQDQFYREKVWTAFREGLAAYEILEKYPEQAEWMKDNIGKWEDDFMRRQVEYVKRRNGYVALSAIVRETAKTVAVEVTIEKSGSKEKAHPVSLVPEKQGETRSGVAMAC